MKDRDREKQMGWICSSRAYAQRWKKKTWLFFFLPQDGAIEMNSAIEQEALVNAFSMFISLIRGDQKNGVRFELVYATV